MKKCPACQAELPAGAIICAYCGSSVVPAALSLSQRTAIQEKAAKWNDLLASRISHITRIVIGVAGVLIGLIAALVYLLTLIMGLNLSWSLSLGITLLLMELFFAALIRNQLAYRASADLFQSNISSQIQSLSDDKKVPRWQLEALIRDSLSEHEPLRQFLSPTQK